MDAKKHLEKIRSLSDSQKKIIVYAIVGIIAVVMAYFWINSAAKTILDATKAIKPAEISNIIKTTTSSDQSPVTQNLPDQNADWQTYINNQYGFGFQYPNGYSVTQLGNDLQWSVSSEKLKVAFEIAIVKTSDIKTLSSEIIGNTTIGGISGNIIKVMTASEDKCYDIYVPKNDQTFVFNNCQDDKTIYNKILSSFKFTK